MLDPDLLLHLAATNAARRRGLVAAAEAGLERTFAANEHLAVYGTLAPGGSNHDQLVGCRGTWTTGTVRGWRSVREFPVFTFDAAAPPVPMHVLRSASLPAHWARLDAFEGDDYERILVPVARSDGAVVVANLYAARTPVSPSAGAPADR